jgi:pSer/pThr/pTyr-binding forkhead associated (FHA) protein
MFSLEIAFADDPANVEYLLVRRPRFSIGSAKSANVTLDEMASLGFDIEVVRGLGSSFSCKPIALDGGSSEQYKFLANSYSDSGKIELGPVSLKITALESDLLVKESDTPDKASTRIFRQSLAFESPKFPAWVILGNTPLVVSFSPEQSILIGRSNKCLLRVDSADVSQEHARLGFESGAFWIEDLGSTNGTFVEGQQISGRQEINPETRVMIGGHTVILGVSSKEELTRVLNPNEQAAPKIVTPQTTQLNYPKLISNSDLMRPGRFTLRAGASIVVGRDPDNDVWIGAPHISRKHFAVAVSKTGEVAITDMSRNGMAWSQGILPRNQPFVITAGSNIFDLGGGVTVALVGNQEEEESYLALKNSVTESSPKASSASNSELIKPQPIAMADTSIKVASEPGMEQSKKVAHNSHKFGSQKPASRSRLGLWMLILSGIMIGAVVVLLVIQRFK